MLRGFLSAICVIATLITIFAAIIALVHFVNKKNCRTAFSEYSPEYTFWGGCRIELNGKMTPVDMIRAMDL